MQYTFLLFGLTPTVTIIVVGDAMNVIELPLHSDYGAT